MATISLRIHRSIKAAMMVIVVNASVIACVGGAAGTSGGLETWEPAPASQDRAVKTNRDPTPPSTDRASTTGTFDPAPGAQGVGGPGANASSGGGGAAVGGLECPALYSCLEQGKTRADTVLVQSVNGKCVAENLTVEPDGRLTRNGRQVGTWAATATGFTASTDNDLVTCTKIVSGTSSASSSSGSTSGSGSSSSSSGTVVVDAGR